MDKGFFKYAVTGIQVNNKENYQKLMHVVAKNQIKITDIW